MDNMERKLIFRCRVGSHLYGLQRPESDVDYMSVFLPTSKDLLGLTPVHEVDNSTKSSKEDRRNTADDIDDKMYAFPKFMHLLLQNNPNIVEVLFATDDVIETVEPEFRFLMDNYQKIISQRVFHTFTGYAFSQKKKLTVKSERYKSLIRATIVIGKEWDQKPHDYVLTEEDAEELNSLVKYYKGKGGNTEHFHKGMSLWMIYKKLCEERDNYGWRVKTDSFDTLGYDVKFGYHLIRILAEGHQLLKTGKLEYPISDPARRDIIRVREGEVEIDELLQMYNRYDKLCKDALEDTPLRKKPDYHFADDFLVQTLKKRIKEEDE